MTDPITPWKTDGAAHGWTMPRVPGWWRWWGVRHVRWWWLDHDHRILASAFMSHRSGYDRWVLFGIWHGLELKQDEPGGGE